MGCATVGYAHVRLSATEIRCTPILHQTAPAEPLTPSIGDSLVCYQHCTWLISCHRCLTQARTELAAEVERVSQEAAAREAELAAELAAEREERAAAKDQV